MQAGLAAFLLERYDLAAPGQEIAFEAPFETHGKRLACLVRTPRGPFVVKVTDPGRAEATVRADVETPHHLAGLGFPAPRPVPARDGQLYLPYGDRFVYLYEYLEGTRPAPSPRFYAALGALLARLHSLPAGPAVPVSAYLPAGVLAETRRLLLGVTCPARQALVRELVALIDRFPPLDDLPAGIIHTDPYFVNLVEAPDGSLALIDWDDGGVGIPLLDVGYVLAHLCTFTARDRALLGLPEDGVVDGILWRPDWARGFLAAYQAIRPLTAREQDHLIDAARLAFLVYIYDWDTGKIIVENYRRMKIVEGAFSLS